MQQIRSSEHEYESLLGTMGAFSLVCHFGDRVEAGFPQIWLQAVPAHTTLLNPSRIPLALRLYGRPSQPTSYVA